MNACRSSARILIPARFDMPSFTARSRPLLMYSLIVEGCKPRC